MVVLDIAMYIMILNKKKLCASAEAARTASRQVVMRFQQHKEHDHPEQIFLQGARLRAGTTSRFRLLGRIMGLPVII
jgi:hypothetical protein